MQRLIMATWDLSHFFESAILDIIAQAARFSMMWRGAFCSCFRACLQLHPMNHIVPKIHLSGEYVYPLAFSILKSHYSK